MDVSARWVAATAGAGFGLLARDVHRAGPLGSWEQRRLHGPREPAGAWPVVTRIGAPTSLLMLTTVAAAAAALRHRPVLRPGATVLLGGTVRSVTMLLVDRDRPPDEWWLVEPDGPSFPSRHVTWAALGLLVVCREIPEPIRPAAAVGAALLLATECYSRVRLGVHWPSDVVGALLLCTVVAAVTQPSRDRRDSPDRLRSRVQPC